jgi:thiol-disulfide isomerase/thioredoxin
MHGRFFLLAAACCVAFAPAFAAPAPRVTSVASLDDLRTPLPYPFTPDADADADVDAAIDKAREEHKRVFIDLGGNWCGDCRILAALMELPETKPFFDAHFVIVSVDVGRMNRNLQIPARWGVADELRALPGILIVDPVADRLVNPSDLDALSDARRMDPQSIVDWMAQWAQ